MRPALPARRRWALPSTLADATDINIVRDAEAEALLHDYTAPIFKATGIMGRLIRIHATRAQERLKPGTPPWLRADDIISYKPLKIR